MPGLCRLLFGGVEPLEVCPARYSDGARSGFALLKLFCDAYKKRRSSSGLIPICRIMPRSVPILRSRLCMGMGTIRCSTGCFMMWWLPLTRASSQPPCFSSARISSFGCDCW